MNKTTIQVLVCVFLVVVSFIVGYNTHPKTEKYICEDSSYTQELLQAYDAYNRDCEILLDSIAMWDNSFADIVCETDVYDNYLQSRHLVDRKILNYQIYKEK